MKPALRVAVGGAPRVRMSLTAQLPATATSLAALLPNVAMLAPTTQDAACTLGVAIAATAWVKGCTALAARGAMPANLSRKIIHAGSGPFFLVCWALFTDLPSARLLAAIVPALQIARLWLASRGQLGTAGEEMVRGISRTGSDSEVAGGPLVYTWVLLAATLLGWRSIYAAVAVCQMAVGDGLADIIGRRFGTIKWPFSRSKSLAGSAAFVAGAFAASLGMVAWFQLCGFTSLGVAEAALPLLAISFACAAVELAPLGDDNLTVPLVAAALSVGSFGLV